MTVGQLINELRANGCNDNTVQFAVNCYMQGFKDGALGMRDKSAELVDENAKRCSSNSMAQMILYANATAIRAVELQ